MSKLITYVAVVAGILLLFHYTGIIGDTEGSRIFNIILHPENNPISSPANTLALALTSIAGVAIVIGALAGHLELAIFIGMATLFWNLLQDMGVIFTKVSSVNTFLAIIIFAIPMLIFTIVLFDWWRGRSA